MFEMKMVAAALVVGLWTCGCAIDTQTKDENASSSGGGSTPNDGFDAGVPEVPRACPVAPSTDPLVVATDKGLIRGKETGAGFAFLGIPYAKPPIGELRLMPPAPADCWPSVKDTTIYGNMCVQTPLKLNQSDVVGSEDCLTLNVWTPALRPSSTKALPVLVWKHGGFFVAGATSQANAEGNALYDGQELANANGAVVVSFNHRLGVLGWLAHPALAAANPEHTTGNYALLDTLLALRWVQDNIASFHGDKTRVMLFGESAGATDTCALVSSPLARGLFSSALMQSGNCAAETLDFRQKDEASILNEVECSNSTDVVACLRSAPLSAFVRAGGNQVVGKMLWRDTINVDPTHFMSVPLGPTVDGYVLPDIPIATIQEGKHNHVPLLVGTNAEEIAWLLPRSILPALPIASCVGFATFVNAMFPFVTRPGLAARLLAAYPCNLLDPNGGYDALVAMTSDAFFTCPSRRMLRAAASTQAEPLYRYFYTHTHSSGTWAPLGAAHAGELPFVWGTFSYFAMTPTAAETTLSRQVQAYWTNFAGSGNPNGGALPNWKAYDPAVDNALELATPIDVTAAVHAKRCDIWDSVQ